MVLSEMNKLLTLIDQNNDNICLFLGAGADISSGGPLFSELKSKIIDKFTEYSANAMSNIDIQKIFEKTIDSIPNYNSREAFQNDINGEVHQIVDSYKILLLLFQHKIVDTIITTNYFRYFEEIKENNPGPDFDIFTNGVSNTSSTDNSKPVYIKLHGDAKYKVTHVTDKEINEKPYAPETVKAFVSHIRGKSIIFIGYSGNDAAVTKIIKDNINQINRTYWILPKESDSPLVEILKESNKYYFCSAAFDDFMINWGVNKLSKIKQNDFRPLFISSLLEANAKRTTEQLCKQYKNTIEREEIENKLNAVTHVGFVFGRPGIGKTAVLKNYICYQTNTVLYIDLNNSSTEKILQTIVSALGFSSDSPFSFLHRLCSWYNDQKQYFTFVIDGIVEFDRNVEDIILLTKLNENNKYVTFIYSSRTKYYNTVCTLSIDVENMIEVKAFNQEEIKQMLKVNKVQSSFTKEYMELMQEPYICYIFCEHYSKNTLNNNISVFEAIEEVLQRKYDCKRAQIHNLFMYIAASECQCENKEITIPNSIFQLLDCGLLESNKIKFKYKKMTQYYLYLYLSKKNLQCDDIINQIQQNFNYSNNVHCAYKFLFTNCETVKKATENILKLNYLLNSTNVAFSMHIIKFVRECIFDIIHQNEDNFTSAIEGCSIDKLCDDIKYIIISAAKVIKNDYNSYKVLGHFRLDRELKFSSFIFYSDILCEKLLTYYSRDDIEKYFTNSCQYMVNKEEDKIIIILYCLMKFNISDMNYKPITEYLLSELKKLLVSNCQGCASSILKIMKKYSYNVLFNSGIDVESDYSYISYDEEYISIINHLKNNRTITECQLDSLAQSQDISNNMILFLLFNLTIVYSMQINKRETLSTINKMLSNGKDLNPENIDFILSCSFMALYHDNPINRKDFVDIFDKTCQLYETKMFEQPSIKRQSTFCKFTEEFDTIFEDGFNPTAFLFYTAPIDKTGDALKKYDELCSILWESGNHSKILKIVHSIGQMISIYPENGFAELRKLLKYDEQIIRRGIVRILAENIQRFPVETINFINDSQIELTNDDLLCIWGSQKKFVENRTFEQLHWSRLLYTLSLQNKDLIKKILFSTQKTNKLSNFISLLCDV